jgi:hypothetical protein
MVGHTGSLPAAIKAVETVDTELGRSRQRSGRRLAGYFSDALLFEAKALVLMLLAWHATEPWKIRPLLLIPFIVMSLLYTLFLPMLYGVLHFDARFPVVELQTKAAAMPNGTGRLYLLNAGDDDFVLWHAGERHVLWVPKSEVLLARIGRAEPVLGTAPATGGDKEGKP